VPDELKVNPSILSFNFSAAHENSAPWYCLLLSSAEVKSGVLTANKNRRQALHEVRHGGSQRSVVKPGGFEVVLI